MTMGHSILHIVPEDESIELMKFGWAIADASPCGCSKGILNKANSLMPLLCNLIQVAIWIKYHIKVVTFTGNMNLIIPKHQRHQGYFIQISKVSQHLLSKRNMFMLLIWRLISN